MKPTGILLLTAYLSGLTACCGQRTFLIESDAQGQKVLAKYGQQLSSDKVRVLGPYAAAPIRYRQAKPTSEAVLTGHVSLRLEDGKLVSQPAAYVAGKDNVTFTDGAGTYKLALTPGRYELRAGGVGLLRSLAGPLQVAAGDSIRVDFKLLSEFRPTYN